LKKENVQGQMILMVRIKVKNIVNKKIEMLENIVIGNPNNIDHLLLKEVGIVNIETKTRMIKNVEKKIDIASIKIKENITKNKIKIDQIKKNQNYQINPFL